MQHSLDVVSMLGAEIMSMLCNVENSTLNFVSFSASDQRYFNLRPQRSNNVNPTLKYWLGLSVKDISFSVTYHCSTPFLGLHNIPKTL